jgi:hypothetical protein
VPTCSYAVGFFKKYQEYQDILKWELNRSHFLWNGLLNA